MKLGFLTGARSEYGVMRRLIKSVSEDPFFTPVIYATGMHFQHKYGYTIREIKSDGYAFIVEIPCYTEQQRDKNEDFIALIDSISKSLAKNRPDILYLIGDRLEAYAGALAAHFMHIPVAHFAGGQITEGAVDNIYRYNISNLSAIHFVTNKYAVERLLRLPTVDGRNVHLVGSSAIDNIAAYLKEPRSLTDVDPRLIRDSYVLMTFHAQTVGDFDVPRAMDLAVKTIIDENSKVLITYPNNDDGADEIISVIKKWECNPNVIVIPNLGAANYHAAIDNAIFVIGNSSSGVIEVPYFSKFTVNAGQRQQGRNAPRSVINTGSDLDLLKSTIIDILHRKVIVPEQEYIYGRGNSVEKIIEIFKTTVL